VHFHSSRSSGKVSNLVSKIAPETRNTLFISSKL
jgi:hypothetical protein